MCVLFRYADPAIGLSIFVIVLHAIAGMIAFQIEIKENYGEEFKKLLTWVIIQRLFIFLINFLREYKTTVYAYCISEIIYGLLVMAAVVEINRKIDKENKAAMAEYQQKSNQVKPVPMPEIQRVGF